MSIRTEPLIGVARAQPRRRPASLAAWLDREAVFSWLMMAAPILFLVAFVGYPFVYGILLSLQDRPVAHVGTFVGLMLALLVCLNIESIRQFLSWFTGTTLFDPALYFLSRLPAEVDVRETTAVVVMALTLSLLATLYPSWRAARLDPVEALRYE